MILDMGASGWIGLIARAALKKAASYAEIDCDCLRGTASVERSPGGMLDGDVGMERNLRDLAADKMHAAGQETWIACTDMPTDTRTTGPNYTCADINRSSRIGAGSLFRWFKTCAVNDAECDLLQNAACR
jgi:hypothetical protein